MINYKPKFLTKFMTNYAIIAWVVMIVSNVFSYYKLTSFYEYASIITMIGGLFFVILCVIRVKPFYQERELYRESIRKNDIHE